MATDAEALAEAPMTYQEAVQATARSETWLSAESAVDLIKGFLGTNCECQPRHTSSIAATELQAEEVVKHFRPAEGAAPGRAALAAVANKDQGRWRQRGYKPAPKEAADETARKKLGAAEQALEILAAAAAATKLKAETVAKASLWAGSAAAEAAARLAAAQKAVARLRAEQAPSLNTAEE